MRTKISLLFPVLSIGLLPGCTGKAVVETENQAPSAPVTRALAQACIQ